MSARVWRLEQDTEKSCREAAQKGAERSDLPSRFSNKFCIDWLHGHLTRNRRKHVKDRVFFLFRLIFVVPGFALFGSGSRQYGGDQREGKPESACARNNSFRDLQKRPGAGNPNAHSDCHAHSDSHANADVRALIPDSQNI